MQAIFAIEGTRSRLALALGESERPQLQRQPVRERSCELHGEGHLLGCLPATIMDDKPALDAAASCTLRRIICVEFDFTGVTSAH